MILAPVAVLSLLVRGSLIDLPVFAACFSFPAAVSCGLIRDWLGRGLSSRLDFIATIIVVVIPAAGGQSCGGQSGA
jgi:hypothetical protein